MSEEGVIDPWVSDLRFPAADRAVEDIGEWLRTTLARDAGAHDTSRTAS